MNPMLSITLSGPWRVGEGTGVLSDPDHRPAGGARVGEERSIVKMWKWKASQRSWISLVTFTEATVTLLCNTQCMHSRQRKFPVQSNEGTKQSLVKTVHLLSCLLTSSSVLFLFFFLTNTWTKPEVGQSSCHTDWMKQIFSDILFIVLMTLIFLYLLVDDLKISIAIFPIFRGDFYTLLNSNDDQTAVSYQHGIKVLH